MSSTTSTGVEAVVAMPDALIALVAQADSPGGPVVLVADVPTAPDGRSSG